MVAPLRDSIGGIFPSSIQDTLASSFISQVLFIMGVIMCSVLWVVRRWGGRVQDSVHASPPPPHTCPRQFILLSVSPIKRHLYFVNLCNFQMLLLSVRQRLSPPRADRVWSGTLRVLISYLNIVQKCSFGSGVGTHL